MYLLLFQCAFLLYVLLHEVLFVGGAGSPAEEQFFARPAVVFDLSHDFDGVLGNVVEFVPVALVDADGTHFDGEHAGVADVGGAFHG